MDEFEKKLEIAKKFLREKTQCSVIILFGSFSRGTQNNESDVDIAIKSKELLMPRDILEISQTLEDVFKRDVDLINLDDIQDGFRYEILINGKIIYCEDEFKFEQYRLDMFREYLELNESRHEIIKNIKEGKS